MRADIGARDPGIVRAMPPGYEISIVLESAEQVLRYEQLIVEAARRCGYIPIRLAPAQGGNGTFADPYLLWGNGSAVVRYYVERDEDADQVQMHVAAADQRLAELILELCGPRSEEAN